MEMRLVHNYDLPPGCCTFCRSTVLPAVDTGVTDDDIFVFQVNAEHQGAVFMCANCAREVMGMFGAIDADTATRLNEQVTSLGAEVAALTQERDALNEVVELLQKARSAKETASV